MEDFPKIDIGTDLKKMVEIINSKPRNDYVLINRHYLDALLSELIKTTPRVLTLDEMQSFDGAVLVEYTGTFGQEMTEWLLFRRTAYNWIAFTNVKRTEVLFEIVEYGKSWRCWTSRPTDEQRKVVKLKDADAAN